MAEAGVRDVRVVVSHWGARLGLGIGAALSAFLLLWEYPRAQTLLVRSQSLRAEDLEAVLAWTPSIPSEARARLGLLYLYDPLTFDPERAREHLRRAVRENPFDFQNWMHLGQGYEAVGDRRQAEAAYRLALMCAPRYFLPQWLYAHFLLKQGERQRALEAFARAARLNPEAVPNIGAVLEDAELLLQMDRAARSASVRARLCAFLISRGALGPALSLWRALEGEEGTKLWLARALIWRGIGAGEYALAHTLWRTVVQKLFDHGITPPEAIWNGSFELPSLEQAMAAMPRPPFEIPWEPEASGPSFEWKIEGTDRVLAAVTDSEAYQGKRAVQIEFVGSEGVRFSGIAQFVLLRPETSYELRFACKADLRGDPRLLVEIVDAPRGVPQPTAVRLRWELPPEAKATGWTLVRRSFETGPAELVLLRIRREPSASLADFVKGRIWFDAFSIRPIPQNDSESERVARGIQK